MHLQLIVVATFLLLTSAKSSNLHASCIIPIDNKVSGWRNMPLIFTNNGELYTNKQEEPAAELKLQNNDKVLLSCAPNYFQHIDNKLETYAAQCQGAQLKNELHTTQKLGKKELKCDLRVIEQVLGPVNGCADEKLSAVHFGYVNPILERTFILGEVCYDMQAGSTHFAHVRLGTKENHINTAVRTYFTQGKLPDESYKTQLFRGLFYDELYTRIREQLKINQAPFMSFSHYINEPLFGNEQLQDVKKLAWNYFVTFDEMKAFETLKKDISAYGKTQEKLDVFIGSDGVLKLRKNNAVDGTTIPLYLHADAKRFPVPELFWILIRNKDSTNAFIIFNDLNEETENAINKPEILAVRRDIKCQQKCDKLTWLTKTLALQSTGQKILCCSYEELKQFINNVPNLLK